MTEPWTNIPTSVLDEAEREASAKAWADQQRALAAKTFADAARAQAYQSIRTYASQYPGQLEQPVDRGPTLDWSTVRGSSGQPVEAIQDASDTGRPIDNAVLEGEGNAIPGERVRRNRQDNLSVVPDAGLDFDTQQPNVLPPGNQIERPMRASGAKNVVSAPNEVQGDGQLPVGADVASGHPNQVTAAALHQVLGVLPPALAGAVSRYLTPLVGDGDGGAAAGASNMGLHPEPPIPGATPLDVPASQGQPYFNVGSRYLGPQASGTLQPSDLAPGALGERPTLSPRGAGEAVNTVGVGLQDAVRSLPGGNTAVDWLQQMGRDNPFLQPVDTSTPEGRQKALGTGLDIAMTVGGGGIEKAGAEAAAGVAAKAGAEVERLRLDKFPEPVRDVIQGAAEAGDDFWRTQRRGVIPDAVAEKMADDMGRTVDQMIAGGKAGKAYNTEGTRALRNGLVAQAVKVADLAEQVKAAPTDGRLVAEQMAEGMRLADLSRVAEGARAEAGRTLRAYQAFARDYAADPVSAVQRIYKANNLTAEQAVMKVNEFTKMTAAGANPFQMARFWANIEKPPVNAGDWFRALRYNAMLSGPRTSLVNIVGNALEVPWRGLRDVAASAATGDLRPLRPEVQGIYAGVVKGLTGARQILAHGITAEQAAAGDLPRSLSARLERPVPRAAALALELPGRGMQAADEVFKQVAFGMGKGRAAGIQASKEGLTGQAWLKRVDELVANPDKATVEGALALADRATFHGEMGYLGEKILRPAQEWSPLGVPLGNIVVPFLRTVYHITSRGIDRSPLGAVGTLVDVAKGTYGPRTAANLRSQLGRMDTKALPPGVVPLGERVGDNLMGSVAFAGLALYAAQGNITGKGPEDVQKRRTMEAQGWQPYSIRVGDKWVSYTNWGPMAVPLSFAAALHEGQGQGADWAYDVFTRGAKVLTEQSYLQGIGNIFKVLDQQSGPTYGEKLLEGTLATVVPYGAAINTAGQATDPTLRAPEKGDVASALQARFPVARESVPAKQDVLGRDVPNPQQGLAALSPVKANPVGNDSVVQALLDAGVDVPEPPKTITEGTVRDIPLTQAEQRAYRKIAGDGISQQVAAVLRHPAWASASPADRADEIKAIVEDARQEARDAVLERIGADEAKRRVAATAATPAR